MRVLAIASFVILANCAPSAPPSEPPSPTPPPEVATSGFVDSFTQATVAMGLTDFRAFLIENPITDFLEPTGDISAPAEFEILSGAWPRPDAVRRVKLEDGHYVIERILQNEPELFTYQIWIFTNDVGRGVDQIVGEQRFIPEGPDRTRFEWTYRVLPKSVFTRPFVRASQSDIQSYLQTATNAMAAAANMAAGG